jgi:hypothetical protein
MRCLRYIRWSWDIGGGDATKNLADERYANIPDMQVRHFIETCPVCVGKKKGDVVGII